MNEEKTKTAVEATMAGDALEITCRTSNGALINNANSCTDLGCMAIVGTTAYCIKTIGDNSLATFYTVKDYATYTTNSDAVKGNYTTKTITGLMHANGMAYCPTDKKLYVAGYSDTVHKVFRLSLAGSKEVAFDMPCKVSAIAYYKSGKFIVRADGYERTDNNGNEYYCFLIGAFDEVGKVFVESSRIYGKKGAYTVNQDITYARNHLIVPTVKKELKSDGVTTVYLKNKVLVYFIGDTATQHTATDAAGSFKYYTADTVLNVNKTSAENYSKYEIESMQLVDDQFVFVGNIGRTVAPTSADGFQFLLDFGIIE